MLNKSRYISATSQRQYDIPGASLRGPYKRWIPQADSRLSESESEVPRSSSRRPSGHHAPGGHSTKIESSVPAPPTSVSRNPAGYTSQHHSAPSQQHRSDHQSHGYSSESTIHAPVPPTKSSSSGFNIFRSHNKESKSHSSSTQKRDNAFRSTTVSSRHPPPPTRSNRDPVSSVPTGAYDPYATPSSSDPSPRSSTDSGPRNGHVSAPPAENFEARRNGQTIWNPYVETKLYSSSRRPHISSSSRREDGRTRDRDDMVSKVTEALGNESSIKTRVPDTTTPQAQNQATKGDDASSTRRTISSTASHGIESSSRVHPQAPPTLRRTKATNSDIPPNTHAYLPETTNKSSHPSLPSSRTSAEPQSRVQNQPELSGKSAPTMSKLPTSSATTSTPKLPHSRTASSPWPFNQALPIERVSSPKPQAQAQTQVPSSHNHSTGWRSFSRLHGSSATTKIPDVRSPPKDATLNIPVQDLSRSSQVATLSPPNRSLPRSTATSTPSSRPGPPVSVSVAIPVPPTQHHTRTRHDTHLSNTTIPTEQSQRVLNEVASKPVTPSTITPQAPVVSQQYDAPPTRSSDNNIAAHGASDMATTTGRTARYPNKDILPPLPVNGYTPNARIKGTHTPPDSMPISPAASSLRPVDANDSFVVPELVPASHPVDVNVTSIQTPSAKLAPTNTAQQSLHGSQSQWYSPPPPTTNPTTSLSSLTSRYASLSSQAALSPQVGTWNSNGLSSFSNNGISYASQGFTNSSVSKSSQSGSRSNPPTPPEHDKPNTEKSTTPANNSGPWSKFSNADISAVTFEDISTPKATRNNAFGEEVPTLVPKLAPGIDASPEKIIHAELFEPVESASYAVPVPGAWTTSSRYTTSTPGPSFHSAPFSSSSTNVRENSTTTRQAILGTTSVAGAWTTRSSLPSAPLATSDSPPKMTTLRNPSPPSFFKPLPPSSSETGTGSSTPSSTQPSDAHSSEKVQSERVPISGHPSTPAPIRPVLRPTPPPLSISSTLPDTDSLLTPSSLNSPRSTILLPQSLPTVPVTTSPQGQRKAGFFDFLRPKPTPYETSKPSPYEVWMPPNRDKDRKRDSSPKASATASSGSKASVSMPTPRPKSPKFFSPFKLFSRRHRTISTASLDVLDGTAANTLMNSPASSMRAETPGAPPSPPLRDAILATQEWRNREASDLIQSGRKRRHRPGVTFDCPEDIAPADVIPTRLRVPRLLEDDDDY